MKKNDGCRIKATLVLAACFIVWAGEKLGNVDAFYSNNFGAAKPMAPTVPKFNNNNDNLNRYQHHHNDHHRLQVSLYTPTDNFIMEEYEDQDSDRHQHLKNGKDFVQHVVQKNGYQENNGQQQDSDNTRNNGQSDPKRKGRNHHSSRPKTQRRRPNSNSSSFPFQQYLKGIAKGFVSKFAAAQRMDDELKRMEMITYGLRSRDDISYQNIEDTQSSFKGEYVKPDSRCYVSVCNAYANSGYGEQAAILAEEVAARYEKLTGLKPGTHIMTSVMKAWLKSENWGKADEWFTRMETRYGETRDPQDLPDTVTYSNYISGLSTTRSLDKEIVGTKSVEMLRKMRESYLSGTNPNSMPNRFTYSFVMKCQEKAYENNGYECIAQVEKVYRQLEDDYYNVFQANSLKPNAQIGLGLLRAVSRCKGGVKAAQKAEEMLEEFRQRYKETGDLDFKPVEGMYTSLLTTYGKVEQKSAYTYARKVEAVLEDMNNYGIEPNQYTMTAAISAKVNDKTAESIQEAEQLLKRLKEPDSVAYQCRKYSIYRSPLRFFFLSISIFFHF